MPILATYYAHNCTNQPIYVTVTDNTQIEVRPGETAKLPSIGWLEQNVSFARKMDGQDLNTKVIQKEGEMFVHYQGAEVLEKLAEYKLLQVGMPIFSIYLPKEDLPLCVVLNS